MEERAPYKNNFEKYRLEKGLSIDTVAHMLDCTETEIIDIEKGHISPQLQLAFKLCALYNVTLKDAYEELYDSLAAKLQSGKMN